MGAAKDNRAAIAIEVEAEHSMSSPQGSDKHPGPIDTEPARELPGDKATPESAAAAIVQGILAGRDAIFPDPMALQIKHLWRNDAPQLELAISRRG